MKKVIIRTFNIIGLCLIPTLIIMYIVGKFVGGDYGKIDTYFYSIKQVYNFMFEPTTDCYIEFFSNSKLDINNSTFNLYDDKNNYFIKDYTLSKLYTEDYNKERFDLYRITFRPTIEMEYKDAKLNIKKNELNYDLLVGDISVKYINEYRELPFAKIFGNFANVNGYHQMVAISLSLNKDLIIQKGEFGSGGCDLEKVRENEKFNDTFHEFVFEDLEKSIPGYTMVKKPTYKDCNFPIYKGYIVPFVYDTNILMNTTYIK